MRNTSPVAAAPSPLISWARRIRRLAARGARGQFGVPVLDHPDLRQRERDEYPDHIQLDQSIGVGVKLSLIHI